MNVRAVFFDVDFTLIYPGPTFRGEGYQRFCASYGIEVDPARFERAVADAAPILNEAGDAYDAAVFVAYTRRIIEGMGGAGDGEPGHPGDLRDTGVLDRCASEIYDEWAGCHHFELYEEVPSVLRELSEAGVRVGLISNSHRCLASFQSHFELDGLIAGAISSPEFGFMKPNPGIFRAALELVGVKAEESVMVGDSVLQDVDGALRSGMRALFLHRGSRPHAEEAALAARSVGVIRTLRDLPANLTRKF